ncbi:MAG: flagella synthesis protein FlgN [Pseudohongiellaceae bacterium]
MIQLSELYTLLDAELDHCLLLGKILLAERSLIETRQLDDLPKILRQKADLLSAVEAGYHQRHSWLNSMGLPDSTSALADAIEQNSLQGRVHTTANSVSPEQCLEKWHELQAAKSDCNEQNTINGIVITSAKKRNSLQLGILKGIRPGKSLYDAKGQTIDQKGSQKSQTA